MHRRVRAACLAAALLSAAVSRCPNVGPGSLTCARPMLNIHHSSQLRYSTQPSRCGCRAARARHCCGPYTRSQSSGRCACLGRIECSRTRKGRWGHQDGQVACAAGCLQANRGSGRRGHKVGRQAGLAGLPTPLAEWCAASSWQREEHGSAPVGLPPHNLQMAAELAQALVLL